MDHFASLVIQRVWRGFVSRRRLWTPGGIYETCAALKIQRMWRGHQGRLLASNIGKEWLNKKANRIIGLYRIWLTNRLIRSAKAQRYERMATRCAYLV